MAPPLPGAQPGPMWADVLTWYQAAKRRFITWQIANYQSTLSKYASGTLNLVLLVPGEHITGAQWDQAVATGAGLPKMGTMIDTSFILDQAAKLGCMVQYTGAQDEKEVAWIRQYMDQQGMDHLPLWGENAGQERNAANNPGRLVQIASAYHFYGVEFIHAGYIFEDDHVTPNDWFNDLQSAYAQELGTLAQG